MDAVAVIDGTGRWWNTDYKSDMKNSFCSQIAGFFEAKDLQRGPSDEGYYFNDKAAAAAAFLMNEKKKGAGRLFLAGYSRGAAIALLAADTLDKQRIKVDGLFLFDPVIRIPSRTSMTTKTMPLNVQFSRTAYRSLDAKIVSKYEDKLENKPYNLLPVASKWDAAVLKRVPFANRVHWLGNPIRPEFGTFRVISAVGADHKTKTFSGSHGALGGVGWRDVSEDRMCQLEVAAWMNEGLAACKLNGKLVPSPPTSTFN